MKTQSEILEIFILFLQNYQNDIKSHIQGMFKLVWDLSTRLNNDPNKESVCIHWTFQF